MDISDAYTTPLALSNDIMMRKKLTPNNMDFQFYEF